MKKAVALLIIAIFLPQQVIYAGGIGDYLANKVKSYGVDTLKAKISNIQSYATTAQSVNRVYTAATNVSSAIRQVTGISARDFISSPRSFIATKLGISAINNYRNLTANNLQTYSQPISSTTIQSPARALNSTALNPPISSLPALSTQNTLSSSDDDPLHTGGRYFTINRNPQPSFDERSKQLLSREWIYRYMVMPITSQYYNSEVVNWNKTPLTDPAVMREKEWKAVTMALYVLPVGQELGIGERLGISSIKYAEPIIQTLKPVLVPLRQGLNYIRPVSNIIWGNKYARTFIVFTGAEVVAGQVYGLVPGLKSPAYNAFADNNGIISDRMNKIRQEEHLLAPGKYNDEMLSGLAETFPYGFATPEGVKRYFEDRKIKTNERVVAYATEIVSLNVQNRNLANDFNLYEKGSTMMAGLSDSLFTPISKGLDSYGVPFAGAFIKNSVGSFNPLTGLSIGMNAGANPSQSWRGFADYVVNPLEAGIGLRRGSIVDGRWDYDPGYRNLGEAAGSLFILRGGGGEALRGAKSAKTQFSLLSLPSGYEKYKTPVTIAVVTLPLAAAAWYEAGQTGDFRAPAGATAVMAMNMFAPSFVRSRFNSQQLDSSMSSMEIAVKTPEMDNAFSLLGKMAKENGKDIKDYASTDQKTTFFEHYSDLKPDVTTEYLLTDRLLAAKVGQPVILIPKTSLPAYNSNSGADNFKNKLLSIQDRIKTKLTGSLPKQDLTKSPIIPVEKLYTHQISTLKKMVTEVTGKVRMVVVRGLGSGKTTALLAYILPYKIKTNLERRKATLILTPNKGVTKDIETILRGANEIGFNHEEIQKQLGTDFEFPREITDKKLKIGSVARNEDSLKQREDFIDKIMNNDVVVVPYELYSSFYHTYLMEKGQVDPVREKVINRIKDSDFIIDEADLPVFFPSTMMSKGRMYVPAGNPEYGYWKDVFGVSRQQYDKAQYKKINPKDMALEKKEGESDAEFEFRSLAQGQKLSHGEKQIPRIEDLPAYDSPAVQNLAKELKSKHAEIEYTDKEIAEHIVHGTWGHRAYELKTSSSINREYAVRTETVPAEQIDIYGPKQAVNTVKIGGIEGTDIDNFNLHIAPGLQQILESHYGAKLISRPLKGEHVGTAIDPLEMLGGGIGLTGTVSDTAKPILEKAGFTKFDYDGKVGKTDFAAPVINEDLSQTVKQLADSIENNKGDRLDINLTPYNSISRKLKIALRSRGIHPARLVPTELTLEHLKEGIAKLSPKKLKELGIKVSKKPTDAEVAKVINMGDQKIFSNLMSPEAAEAIAQIKEQGFPITKVNLKAQLTKARKIMAKRGDLNFSFKEGKYVFIGGQTPEKIAQALLDSLRTKEAPYAIIGTANLIGRGLNFLPPDYLAKYGTKAVVNLISPEHMTDTQVNQGAGRIGGEFRFTRLKDKEGNFHNPEKIVRLLMSKDMMRPMPEFEKALKLDNSQEGAKSLEIIDALHNVWDKNERDVVARSGLSLQITDSKAVKSEFKEVDMPTTLEEIKEKVARDYFVLKGYTTEVIVKKGEAYVKENKLTIKGLRFMQLVKEAEALSADQYKILDKIAEFRLLNINNPIQFAIGLTEKGIVELEDYNKRGLTSLVCLGRILRPFNTDISSEEIKKYQDIINSALEQKLEFIEGLINKNKINIDDGQAKELILKKLGLLRGSLANIQEISRQISAEYAKNKDTILQIDRLHLKSAYREFENIMQYQDLENIGAKLNYSVLTDLIPVFIPNVSTDELARFSAIFDFAKDYKINLAANNLFELLELTNGNNKVDLANFIDKNTKDPYLKIYAQRLALYENALAKQMQYYIQSFSGKTKDAKEFEQSLQEDVDFFRNFNIDPTKGTQLNLDQLRSLSDGKLSDKVLLRIYLDLAISDAEIEDIIVENIISKKGTLQKVFEALAELIRLKKSWGMERAISEVKAKYAPAVVNEAVRYLNFAVGGIGNIPSLGKLNQFMGVELLMKTAADRSLLKAPVTEIARAGESIVNTGFLTGINLPDGFAPVSAVVDTVATSMNFAATGNN